MRRTAILAEAAAVTAALGRRPLTVAELAAEAGLSLRQAYRTLRALEAAGWPVDSSPLAGWEGRGRVPLVYRMRSREARAGGGRPPERERQAARREDNATHPAVAAPDDVGLRKGTCWWHCVTCKSLSVRPRRAPNPWPRCVCGGNLARGQRRRGP
jgi:hypothetical protein